MPTPPSPAPDLAALEARHYAGTQRWSDGTAEQLCAFCGDEWPCDTGTLLAYARELEAQVRLDWMVQDDMRAVLDKVEDERDALAARVAQWADARAARSRLASTVDDAEPALWDAIMAEEQAADDLALAVSRAAPERPDGR